MLVRQCLAQRVAKEFRQVVDGDQLRVGAGIHASPRCYRAITTDTPVARKFCSERITVLCYATHVPVWQQIVASADRRPRGGTHEAVQRLHRNWRTAFRRGPAA